jgi:hypothetical protein
MHIVEVTWLRKADFHFIALCRHCGKRSLWGDGYADAYYQQCVFPARHCEHCGLDEPGDAMPEVRGDG